MIYQIKFLFNESFAESVVTKHISIYLFVYFKSFRMQPILKVERNACAHLPSYATSQSAGLDLFSSEDVFLGVLGLFCSYSSLIIEWFRTSLDLDWIED